MKAVISINILFLFFFTSTAQLQWVNPKPQGNNLHNVKFATTNIGYSVGDAGTIIKTVNGGATWTILSTGTPLQLNGISVVDPNICFAVGTDGLIIKTIDGGISWIILNFVNTDYLNAVCFTDSVHGFVAGYSGTFKTIDGGNNWTQLISTASYALFFINPDTGFVAGCNEIYRTYDAGNTWVTTNLGNAANNCPSSIDFPNLNIGYVSLSHDAIYKTIDGGNYWTLLSIFNGANLKSISFINDLIGFIAIDGPGFLKTINGGLNWSSQYIPHNNSSHLNSICFVDTQTAYAVGENGMIAKTSDQGASWKFQDTSFIDLNLWDIFYTDSLTGFIAGELGTILKTSDGGNTWHSQNSGTSADLRAVYFINPNIGFAAGLSGTILKTTNGGITWSPQTSGTSFHLTNIYFSDANNGIIAGNVVIVRTTNGGSSWTQIPNFGPSPDFTSIYFSTDTFYACTALDGMYSSSNNNGSVWTWVVALGNKRIKSGSFLNSREIYVAGNEGVYKTIDGGDSWITKDTITSFSSFFSSVVCSDVNTCFTYRNDYMSSFKSGLIMSTTDGGDTWIENISGTAKSLNHMSLISDTRLAAVGNEGMILRSNYSGAVGIKPVEAKNKIEIYPNPAIEKIFINSNLPNDLSYSIYNMLGSVIQNGKITITNNSISIKDFSKGIYVLRLYTGSQSFSKTIIKN